MQAVEFSTKVELPAEVLLLIVDQITDFDLWYRARFVCQAWLVRIVVEQDKKVWDFVKFRDNAFLLPNGVKHGIEETIDMDENQKLQMYKYGKYIGAHTIDGKAHTYVFLSTFICRNSHIAYVHIMDKDEQPYIALRTADLCIAFTIDSISLLGYTIIAKSFSAGCNMKSNKMWVHDSESYPIQSS